MSAPHGEHILLIGSGNAGKQQEWRELLAGIDAVLVVPQDLDPVPEEPEERGTTFAENASAKARGLAAAKLRARLAEEPR
ncbi:MAG: hypothetical protein E6J38_01105 [Chloroflexi bacterium]|nr:MAG: hypothetical protein E6J38_01105 [Chloroflexota bacterium]